MAIQSYTIRWNDFPNTGYFIRHARDLHRRFKRILGAVGYGIQISEYLRDIDEYLLLLDDSADETSRKLPSLVIISNTSSFSPPDSYIATTKRKLTACEGKWTPRSQQALEVFICHTSIKHDQSVQEELFKVVDEFFKQTESYTEDCVSSLLFFCELEENDDRESDCIHCIVKLIQERREHWALSKLEEKILVIPGSNKVSPSTKISQILEHSIMVLLDKISNYIKVYTPTLELGGFDVVFDDPTDRCLDETLDHYLSISWVDLKLKDTYSSSQFVEHLSTVLRCEIVPYMSVKYQMPFWVCNTVLYETFSVQTQSLVKPLTPDKVQLNVRDAREIFRAIYKLVPLLEKDLRSVGRFTETLQKVNAEISGYYRQSSTRSDVPKAWPKLPERLRSDILGLKNVFGVGIIYGLLEIHLEEQADPAAKREIERLVRSDGYFMPYRIRIIQDRAK